ARRVLLRDGKTVSLLPKTFEVLCCLVDNPGRLLAKDEILKAVWPESFVEENNLTQHISLLRKALGDRAGYIVTVPGRGYQFTANVTAEPPSPPPFRLEMDVPPAGDAEKAPAPVLPGTDVHTIAQRTGTDAPSVARPPLVRTQVSPWMKFAGAAVLLTAVSGICFSAWKRWAKTPELHKVMVADFWNTTGDPTFDHTLKQALEIDLEQTPYIDVMSEREAMGTLALMGRSEDSVLTADVAREICERSNRQVLLTGNILPIGREYLLTVEASDCASGRKLAAAKAQAPAKEKVLAALDKVADRVRRDLGESRQSMENYEVPIVQATTASLEALRSYSIGQSMDAQGKSEMEALPFYQRAVDLDPQFAMAYGAIANEYYNLSEPNLAAQFYKKAFDLSGRASAKEKLVLEAHYYSEGLQDMERGIDIYRQWAETYPRDWVPWINVANDYTQIGQYMPAIAAGRQALKLQPDRAINYSVLARALMRANQFAEARAVGLEAIRRGKDSTGLHASLYQIAAAVQEPHALAQETQWAASHGSEWYGWYFFFLRAEGAAAAGRRKKAAELFHSAWETAERENLPEAADHILLYQASIELSFGLPEAARGTLSRAHNPNPDMADAALVRAELGDRSSAQRFLSAHTEDAASGTLLANVDLPRVRAKLAMQQGKPLDAVTALEPARPYELANYTVLTERAEAWQKAARPELAIPEYQKILANPGIDPLSPRYPMAHLGMARAYARQKKASESRERYERFFSLWRDADSDLPVLIQARAEYARLGKDARAAR
ncbi:MAG TPA: winged helix-turn-helix domain-containing protein, partial [Terracidiphilus sp.]